ncbi:uncharacterized protein LTR77_005475 [Saxophila tyrrhenica]|uniref:Glycosyltransferase family 2 protein n=1 Tax=Saxophila tyrrhenica TaxID=1690608 RepID=A0AAV9P8N8_9PEZI|nr:hypothetical protein LTR77_005475 [Saxophila tyrrhenica]
MALFQEVDSVALIVYVAFFIFRYLRTVVGIYTWLTYKAVPILEKPTFTAADVSVVCPTTFKTPDELISCLKNIAKCMPSVIYVVTSHANVGPAKNCLDANGLTLVQVLGVDKLNKRVQMLKALEVVDTPITVFADDDVQWPSHLFLDYLLAPFEDPNVGAGGTRQRVIRRSGNMWNWLGIGYLERRNWNNICANAIDGSISTLSGRTAAYRSEILQTDEFRWYFQNDSWRGRPLNSDDDKCLTRYVYSHGWSIKIQSDSHAILETTLEEDSKFIDQCMRWARAHWRGNFTVMENEKYWKSSRYAWGFYAIYLAQFTTPALLMDLFQFLLLQFAFGSCSQSRNIAFAVLLVWIAFTKNVKLIPHLLRSPSDIKFIPVSMAFSYLHGFLNVYAAFTLTHTAWGGKDLKALETAKAPEVAKVRTDETEPLLLQARRLSKTAFVSSRDPTPERQREVTNRA